MCGRRDPCIPTWRGSDGATGNEGTEESAGGGPHQLGQTVFLHASVWRKLGAPANGGAKLLGGPGSGPLILAHPGGPATSP